jgi:hypothetical protein
MKTIGKFTQLGHDFIIKVVIQPSNSNHNLFVHVFHKGEKQPLLDTSFKDGTPDEAIILWAKEHTAKAQAEEFSKSLFDIVDAKYPELDAIATEITCDVLALCNRKTRDVKSEMPYRAQHVLEEVIKKLQEAV